MDIQLEEEGYERGRDGSSGGDGNENATLGIDEVQEDVGRQIRAESCSKVSMRYEDYKNIEYFKKPTLSFGRQKQNMIIRSLAKMEQFQILASRCLVGNIKSASYILSRDMGK